MISSPRTSTSDASRSGSIRIAARQRVGIARVGTRSVKSGSAPIQILISILLPGIGGGWLPV